MIAQGNALVRVEFQDGRVFAFEGKAYIREDVIETRYETPKGKLVKKDTFDRTEVVIHAEHTAHSRGR